MLLSKACIYGIRASLYLASAHDNSFISINLISEKLGISSHFLTKIFQQLSCKGLIESMRGPSGGVRLKQSGDDIFLVEIVAAVDGMDLLTECALGLPGCGTATPCPLHDQWADARDGIRKMLERTTLAELARKGKAGNLRITPEGGFDWTLGY